MFARKASSKTGKSIPQVWLESLARMLDETYADQNKKHDRYFDVYGQIYAEELLLVVSWLPEKDTFSAPVTCFLSCEPEQMNDETKVKATQQSFIDVIGLFFDEVFATEDWAEFEPNWQEVSYKHENYFFKISRENISLSLEANKLLGEDFENDVDVDTDFEEDTDH